MPSLEILDTRILRSDPQSRKGRAIVDTGSDIASNAGVVLGKERDASDAYDLHWKGAIVRKNHEVVATGLGASVLDDPVTALSWPARRMQQYGQKIQAGQVVISCSFIGPFA